MMTVSRIAAALALALSLPAAPIRAFANQSPAFAAADGKPWSATGPGGRQIRMTFYPDGKAKMKMGIMSKAFSWSPTDDGFCLRGLPDGGKCVRLVPTATGYVGYEGDTPTIRLDR